MSIIAGLQRVLADPELALGVLADEPVTLYNTPNGQKLHALSSCGHIRLDPTASRHLLVDVVDRLCESCAEGLPKAHQQRMDAIAWIHSRLERPDRFLASPASRWYDLGDTWDRLLDVNPAFKHNDEDITASLAAAIARRIRLLEERRDQLLANHVACSRHLIESITDVLDMESTETAICAELGVAADFIFEDSRGSFSGGGWSTMGRGLAADTWREGVIHGDSPEQVKAAVEERVLTAWTNSTALKRGQDPAKLLYNGSDFESPTAWADAEHTAARGRILTAAVTDWNTQLADGLDDTALRLYVGPYDEAFDSNDRAVRYGYLVHYGATLRNGRIYAAAPGPVVKRLCQAVNAASWGRAIQTGFDFGPVAPDDTIDTWQMADTLHQDGEFADGAQALEAARLL